MKKIALFVIFIAILFLGPNLIARNMDDFDFNNNDVSLSIIDDGDDFLDQYQYDFSGSGAVHNKQSWGQSIIPSYEIITRIKLYLYSRNTPNFDLHFYLLGNFTGESFIHEIIPKEEIPNGDHTDAEWIEIDFEDIQIIPGQTYYIVLLSSSSSPGSYHWGYGYNTDYTNGDSWYYYEPDELGWVKNSLNDQCFETYGKPNLKKTFITGKIHDISSEGNYLTFNAVKIRCIQLTPFNFITLQSDEELIISKSFKGIVAAGFIFALCDAALI